MSDSTHEPPPPSQSPASRSTARGRVTKHGMLAWVAQNPVAANLLMLVLLIGGLLTLPGIKQEVFPEFELDLIIINVAYPGASPSEVEQGVILAVEEAVRAVDGIKEVRSTAAEGVGVVTVELMLSADPDRALSDVKSAVDRVTSFPKDVERPIVSLALNRRQTVSVVVYGDVSEKALKELAERVRDDLLESAKITVVELAGVRPLEISIEVPQAELRKYNLTLEQIAQRVTAASVELPGGGVKTRGGEILVRTSERKDQAAEFAEIVVLSRPDGSTIRLGDLARIDDGFRETDQEAYFDGQRAVMVNVFRVGDQKPLEISEIVNRYVTEQGPAMPPGVKLAIWNDISEIYADRVSLLERNAWFGLILVFGVLALFLEARLAVWVTMGIPISFIGSLLFMPLADASINMISLFAFIVCLGIVVDDAIVVGEAVYTKRKQGLPPLEAAIAGVREVAVPVTFAVLTTMVAFAPLLFVPGVAGKFFRLIPIVVISVIVISLIESLLVLPAHLTHKGFGVLVGTAALVVALAFGLPQGVGHAIGYGFGTLLIGGVLLLLLGKLGAGRAYGFIERRQRRFSELVEWFAERVYAPFVARAIGRRVLTVSICAAVLLASFGLVGGGHVNFTFMPKVDSDVIVVELEMPHGTAVAETRAITQRALETARTLVRDKSVDGGALRGIFAQVGAAGSMRGGARPGSGSGGHVSEVAVFLVPLKDRGFSSAEFAREWRERIGDIPGARTLKIGFSTGPSAGSPIDVELTHKEIGVLEAAATDVANRLREYQGVYDIDSGFAPGKEQLDFRLKPAARSLGITELDMARQLRSSFFGAEAARQQRGRDELRVYVRLPGDERRSEYDIEELLVRSAEGGEVPVAQAAEIVRGRAYTEIKRRDGRRIVSVTADVDEAISNAGKVLGNLERELLPVVLEDFPGLAYSLEGEQKAQRETMSNLAKGFGFALVAIFVLLAVVFRSYVQPIIIMVVIPFGFVGAVVGHVTMGYDLSLMSMMGVVALSGVVVNDSLILIDAVNQFRREGMSRAEALVAGGTRRFRPILLTSLTTFFGLTPMILETSVQARFLIPMAISLGFGVLLATVICLVLVPAVYAIIDDLASAFARLLGFVRGPAEPEIAPGA
jgi:multidrug efflux pump subunit AcrB